MPGLLGLRGCYAIYFSFNYYCYLLRSGLYFRLHILSVQPAKSKTRCNVRSYVWPPGSLYGLKVECRMPADAQNYGNAIYICNHQNNYDMVTAANIVQPPTVTVGKKACCGSFLRAAVLVNR